MPTPTPRRSALLVAVGALVLVAVSACGGSSSASDSIAVAAGAASGSSNAASPNPARSGRPDFTAYRDCMAKNGVNLPDFRQGNGPGGPAGGAPSGAPTGTPGAGGPGADGAGADGAGPGGPGGFPLPAGVDQATFDKARQACAGLRPNFGGGQRGQIDPTALAAFKSCLGDHNVTVGTGQDWFRQLDRTDPTVAAALKTCGPLLPFPGNRNGSGAPTGSSAASSPATPAAS
jgi:hypothetical protein